MKRTFISVRHSFVITKISLLHLALMQNFWFRRAASYQVQGWPKRNSSPEKKEESYCCGQCRQSHHHETQLKFCALIVTKTHSRDGDVAS